MDYAIDTEGLAKHFGDKVAVRDLCLRVPAGSIFGFLGPNGAGKTTTIRMLLGLLRPTSGGAKIFGKDVLAKRAAISSFVGAIVETPSFYLYMTGKENLATIARSAGLRLGPNAIQNLLDQVGLGPNGGRGVREYSLGMKQRLGIAAALLGDPPLLFLDEPSNGLDPDGMREMRDLIQTIRGMGRTIFMSSHLLGEVERICTDVAIIKQGAVLVQGRVSELLQEAGVELRVSSVQQAARLLNLPEDTHSSEAGWLTLGTVEGKLSPVLLQLLHGGVEILEMRQKKASLEELFFSTTSGVPHGAQGVAA